jgi:hypothetical protein
MAKNFPVMELTQEEYDKLPVLESVSGLERAKMDIGFMFKFPESVSKCSQCQTVLGVERIICKVVEPLDAIEDQVGGGMLGIGNKFINRYQAKIVPDKK